MYRMKLSYFLLLLLSISVGTMKAQKMSAETYRWLKEISGAFGGESINQHWVNTHFPTLPIYRVNGEWCLSMVSRVEAGFKPDNLNGIAYTGAHVGQVLTIKYPLRSITYPLIIKGIEYLEIAERIQPLNNKMTADVRADSVWMGINLPQGFTGKDVLIGVTDWGFDYEHPMFMDTLLTATRIRAAWDHFKQVGTPPAGMGYGAEYNTVVDLLAAKCDTASVYYDYSTHGSHVAGIAGGSGAGLPYRGVAFEAEFLFNSIQLDVGAAIDALQWMKNVANEDGKRLVINASWGLYYMGTMDGTSLLSQVIDQLADEGVVFVTSAGNNGNVNLHIKKEFNNDTIRSRIAFYGYQNHASMWGQCVSMWGEPSKPFSANFEVYNSSNVLLGTSPVYATQTSSGYHNNVLVIGQDTIFYNYTIDGAHPLNNRPHIRMRVKNTNTSLRIVLRSFAPAGTVHYWNVVELSNGVGNWGMSFINFGEHGVAGDSFYSLGEPACTEKAITVASHVAESVIGGVLTPGNRSAFASKGPTYDERMKPDISAPGSNVVSSINSYTTNSFTSVAFTFFNGRQYHFASFSGTSMSSPAVAGVVALLLEANPMLTADEVKQIVKVTARQDNKTGDINFPGSSLWGMGRVNATAAIHIALNPIILEIDEVEMYDNELFPNPAKDYITLRWNEKNTLPVQCEIVDIQGKLILQTILNHSQIISVADWSKGMYFVKLNGDKSQVIKFIKE
jgi:minor extracellular serine protease Vpr